MNETNSQLPIPRTSLVQMVEVYNRNIETIKTAFAQLVLAQEELFQTFEGGERNYHFNIASVMDRRHVDFEKPQDLIAEFKKSAWRALVDKMELRRIMAIKSKEQLDKQISDGDVPEVTVENIIAMMQTQLGRMDQLLAEAVHEVFDFLMPWDKTEYKTNQKYRLGSDKVIIGWAVRPAYGSRPGFRVEYSKQQKFTATDNVFHLMDGKGTVKTHQGPLCDAIEQCGPEGVGETDYFKFRCFGNGNLHLQFKRPDLVTKMNAVANGNALPMQTAA
jgi:hypothetical protein